MGLMALNRLMSRQREQKQKRNRGRMEANNGWIASFSKRNRSPCRQDVNSHGGKKVRYPMPDLPEDIWRHIHFLLPMQDAARAACLSRSFQSSWKCYPNLTFTNETMCSKENLCKRTTGSNVIRDYNNKIDRVLRNHSGAGVKKLRLEYYVIPCDAEPYHHLTSWLQIAVTPGIEQVHLTLSPKDATFNFPCMLLSETCQGSMQYLHLANLDLHPTFQLGLRTLRTLHLCNVHITEDELGCLLTHSFALAHLRLQYCHDIIRLEIPCLLQRLRFLEVLECSLQVLEINAPNIFRLRLLDFSVQFLLGKSWKMKNLMLNNSCVISYAIDNLPSCAPKVETLTIHSSYEILNAPVASSKFRHLKFLNIYLAGLHSHRDYDYLSLVSFLDASPLLEKFVLLVSRVQSKYDWFEGDPSSLRQMSEHRHRNLKSVKISSFCPQKSMLELARHILENATSLECLTLDTTPISHRCSGDMLDRKCPPLETECIRDAHKSNLAVRKYIEGKVNSTVKLNLLGPCSRCYAL
ncbi:unnamed protein product [Triticum turgidum subsp. durum]|uniref:F-box domain-containing protein n=1 Tax=Triticum turgidum subsp. durum TaxID=4567 RepID=A0A9R0XCW9_TRITD|nr:unnamed protein product [Triticum turgidum subsp. durum]